MVMDLTFGSNLCITFLLVFPVSFIGTYRYVTVFTYGKPSAQQVYKHRFVSYKSMVELLTVV